MTEQRSLLLSSRRLKSTVEKLLREKNLEDVLVRLQDLPAKNLVHALFTAICREEPHMKWFAVSCMGMTVDRLAEESFEEARVVMRRFLWSLNDESGGIGWGAPESLAEIMYHNDRLAKEYHHMLLSYAQEDGEEICQDGNFLEHTFLQRGVMWGIGRLALKRGNLLRQKIRDQDFRYYLTQKEDKQVQGLAAWAVGNLGLRTLIPELSALINEDAGLSLYLDGIWSPQTVGRLAGEALRAIG